MKNKQTYESEVERGQVSINLKNKWAYYKYIGI